MSRTVQEIIADIGLWRQANRELYGQMRAMIQHGDSTLKLIEAAYALDPDGARYLHREIAENDAKILALTRELCG